MLLLRARRSTESGRKASGSDGLAGTMMEGIEKGAGRQQIYGQTYTNSLLVPILKQ
jgi:hypothetical protein